MGDRLPGSKVGSDIELNLGAKLVSKNREQTSGAKIGSKNWSRVGSINGNDMEGREQKKVE